MKINLVIGFFILGALWGCKQEVKKEHDHGSFFVSQPIQRDTILYDVYVCQIRSHQHIELRALEGGYLEKILVDEGQGVRKGQLMFQILPTIYRAEKQKAEAELEFAKIEYRNEKALADSNIVSQNELALARAELLKAEAELALAQAHLGFTEIRAPFDGLTGRFEEVRLGSLVEEGELLTTLSDNSKMWVYFNVPESKYLDYAKVQQSSEPQKVKLRLANNTLFERDGFIETIESDFDNTTGNIAFRAAFENPEKLLRHGQTGNILWPRVIKDVLMIPQKSTFEVLDKKFVFIVDDEGHVHPKEIKIIGEIDHIYMVSDGISTKDNILLEGLNKVKSGDHIEFESKEMTEVLNGLHLHAE